jgi:predicted transglutaminase-like cysteine proteinase
MALLAANVAAEAGSREAPLIRAGGSALVEKRPALAPFSHVLFCRHYPGECTPPAGQGTVTLGKRLAGELDRVNRAVNRMIRPVRETGRGIDGDRWLIAPASGDCDDYAVTKRHRLVAAGWPPAALRIAVVFTPQGEGHAVLVVRTDAGDVVLDNRTDRILGWDKTGLRFVKMQSGIHPLLWSEV